jgi:molybdate transport system substrate-binding protein
MTAPVGPGTPAAPAKSLTVFAAASLTESFGEIKEQFEAANPGVAVTLNFASSALLAQQLSQGAPADVFASADLEKMEIVAEARRVSGDGQQIFARNRLVVIMPRENPARIKSLPDLANPGLRLLLASKEVPVGNYSLDFLDKANRDPALGKTYKDEVIGNVVSYEENVKAVFSKVALGEADAGIVYTSDLAQGNREKVAVLEIPDSLNIVAEYAIAPLRDSANPELAQAFVDFVVSAEGQEILGKFGFIPLGEG